MKNLQIILINVFQSDGSHSSSFKFDGLFLNLPSSYTN